MPRLANMLEFNRYIVYVILAFIWIVSLGTAVPTFDYRRYNVSFINLCQHTVWTLEHRKFRKVNFVSVYQALGKQGTHHAGRSQYTALHTFYGPDCTSQNIFQFELEFPFLFYFFQIYDFKDYTQFLCVEGKFLCMK